MNVVVPEGFAVSSSRQHANPTEEDQVSCLEESRGEIHSANFLAVIFSLVCSPLQEIGPKAIWTKDLDQGIMEMAGAFSGDLHYPRRTSVVALAFGMQLGKEVSSL